MLKVKAQCVANAPVEKVFSYLADLKRVLEVDSKDLTVRLKKTSEGPVGVGSTFRMVVSTWDESRTVEAEVFKKGVWLYQYKHVEVKELVHNRRLVYEVFDEKPRLLSLVTRNSIELDPVAEGTRITTSRRLLFPSLLARLLYLPLHPLLTPVPWRPWDEAVELGRMKSRVETQESGRR
jgi:uncharacterized protein YndB with AHSA1/START domain